MAFATLRRSFAGQQAAANLIELNSADKDFYALGSNVGRNNRLVSGAWPADAQAIIDGSGPAP